MLRETQQDLLVRSSGFRMEKSALECPLWIVVLHLRYNNNKKRGKIGDQFVKPKIECQMKTESETRSSRLADNAGSRNYLVSDFCQR